MNLKPPDFTPEHEYAVVMTAKGMRPGVNAFLNGLDYYNNTVDFHLIGGAAEQNYVEEIQERKDLSFSLFFTDVEDITQMWEMPARKRMGWKVRFYRYQWTSYIRDLYKAVLIVDADMLCLNNIMKWFKAVEGTDLLIMPHNCWGLPLQRVLKAGNINAIKGAASPPFHNMPFFLAPGKWYELLERVIHWGKEEDYGDMATLFRTLFRENLTDYVFPLPNSLWLQTYFYHDPIRDLGDGLEVATDRINMVHRRWWDTGVCEKFVNDIKEEDNLVKGRQNVALFWKYFKFFNTEHKIKLDSAAFHAPQFKTSVASKPPKRVASKTEVKRTVKEVPKTEGPVIGVAEEAIRVYLPWTGEYGAMMRYHVPAVKADPNPKIVCHEAGMECVYPEADGRQIINHIPDELRRDAGSIIDKQLEAEIREKLGNDKMYLTTKNVIRMSNREYFVPKVTKEYNFDADVVLFARDRFWVPRENWPYWSDVAEGLKAAGIRSFIGGFQDESFQLDLPSAWDYDNPLEAIIWAIKHSKMCLGTSTGLTLLCRLCGVRPHVLVTADGYTELAKARKSSAQHLGECDHLEVGSEVVPLMEDPHGVVEYIQRILGS